MLLRPWSLGDAQAVMDAYQDEAIQRWHVQWADSLAEARAWIAGWQGGWAGETGAHWAVTDGGSGILLGRAALKHLKFSDGTADVAYWTVPAARGKGVCPQAVEAMASWAFEVAGFHRFDLEQAVGNTASCHVAEKTGFAAAGTMCTRTRACGVEGRSQRSRSSEFAGFLEGSAPAEQRADWERR